MDERIMIVDDLPLQSRLLKQVLERAGFTALEVEQDPLRALQRFRTEPFDLVLLDYEMPEMNGLQLMEQMLSYRKQQLEDDELALQGLPVIMVTADNQESVRLHALSHGAKDFITKPFNRDEVVSRVTNLLQMQRLQRQLLEQNCLLNAEVNRNRFSNEEQERIEEIDRGIAAGEFILHWQPQVRRMEDGKLRLEGVEGLVRWQQATGLRYPLDFIPLAERSGQIVSLGAELLQQGCRQMQAWRALEQEWMSRVGQGSALQQVPDHFSINLSAQQFADAGLEQQIHDALQRGGIPAHCLCLEITESVVMEDIEQGVALLQRLRQLGVRISIDDFGTGYSSLSYLKHFPIDMIKIDRSFVKELPDDPTSGTIIRAIRQIAAELSIEVVVEGVETEEQLQWLHSEQLNLVQGYCYSKPLPATEVTQGWMVREVPHLQQ